MHWTDRQNKVHSVKPGELIPHYSRIVQVFMDVEKKWIPFTPGTDIKRAQDSCGCASS